MAKDGTMRGGARPGTGPKKKALTERVATGNPGGHELTVIDFGDAAAGLLGADMPPAKEYLNATSMLVPFSLNNTRWRVPDGFSARRLSASTVFLPSILPPAVP